MAKASFYEKAFSRDCVDLSKAVPQGPEPSILTSRQKGHKPRQEEQSGLGRQA